MKRTVWWGAILLAIMPALAAFDRPSENDRLVALGNLFEEPAVLRRLLQPDEGFTPITQPGPDDWLSQHKENGQTFEEFRDSGANRPDASRRVIYLLPLGQFPEENSPRIEEIQAYAAAFFQLEVRILPAFDPPDRQFEPRKNPGSGQRQVRSTSILEFLATRLPVDAYCLLGVTMADLYPAPSWNYVFGQASLGERVGVYSFARYDPAFFCEVRGKYYKELVLRRSCKVLAHETGHMFGLPHCIYYDCLMNGSNHLDEADARPQHLCPICLRKLHHGAGFDAGKRYEDLHHFYRKQRWFEEAIWVGRQLAKVRPGGIQTLQEP